MTEIFTTPDITTLSITDVWDKVHILTKVATLALLGIVVIVGDRSDSQPIGVPRLLNGVPVHGQVCCRYDDHRVIILMQEQ